MGSRKQRSEDRVSKPVSLRELARGTLISDAHVLVLGNEPEP